MSNVQPESGIGQLPQATPGAGTAAPSRLAWSLGPPHLQPLVSIVVPTYRRQDLLLQAVTSALAQQYDRPYEVVVVDNDPASDGAWLRDRLEAIASPPSLRYFVNAGNLGMFGNWNRGIELAQAKWVTLLHDDDWLSPVFLSTITPLLQESVVMAACDVDVGTGDYLETTLRARPPGRVDRLTIDDLVFGNVSPAPGIVFRRDVMRDVGGFDPDLYPCADYEAYVRCARRGQVLRARQTLAYYRTSDSATFKGDTLARMIAQSITIKRRLLADAPAASRLTYVLSMAFWYRLGRQHGVWTHPKMRSSLDRMADVVSRSAPLAFLLSTVRHGCKRVARALERPAPHLDGEVGSR